MILLLYMEIMICYGYYLDNETIKNIKISLENGGYDIKNLKLTNQN